MLPEPRRGQPDRPRRSEQARHDVVHRHEAHLVVGIVGEQLALDDVRVDDDLRNVVDRTGGHLRLVEDRHGLGLGVLGDERADDGVELGGVADPIRVGPELADRR